PNSSPTPSPKVRWQWSERTTASPRATPRWRSSSAPSTRTDEPASSRTIPKKGSSSTVTEYRIEHDTMGEVRVPASALYRAQTQRAVENFPISGTGLEAAQIIALARVKRSAAIANADLG